MPSPMPKASLNQHSMHDFLTQRIVKYSPGQEEIQAFEENQVFTCQLAVENLMKNSGSSHLCLVGLLESSV